MDYDPADGPACLHTDERMIQACTRVLVVWDGSPTTPCDATAHLVAYARGLGRTVDVLWPTGAERRTS
ncbi:MULTISPECIES: hypothetical protein [Streptomyces]|uniref:hypothetical protein n=1 Tax=Streptomyces TaxID=1883 RepID=UPI00068A764C|nr:MULTISPECIES: hypothetical protein [Streptomyces]